MYKFLLNTPNFAINILYHYDRQLHVLDCFCRLPDSANRFFNVSLPYVFWARGDISHATELFCQLSQSEKRCKYFNISIPVNVFYRTYIKLFSHTVSLYNDFVRNVISPPELNMSVVIIIITHSFLELR